MRPSILCSIGLVILSSGFLGCAREPEGDQRDQKSMAEKTIEEVLKEHTDEWMSVPGVVGTAIGACDDVPCIKILIAQRTPEVQEGIPAAVEGFRVEIEVTGEFRALDSARDG